MKKPQDRQPLITLAAGRIVCRRCQARSKRSGVQCAAPSIRGRFVCRTHGGRSTGAKTEAGRMRIAQANTTHGNFTKRAIQTRQEIAARIAALESSMHLLGMTDAPRTRGRKPARYVPVWTVEDVPEALGILGDRVEDESSKN